MSGMGTRTLTHGLAERDLPIPVPTIHMKRFGCRDNLRAPFALVVLDFSTIARSESLQPPATTPQPLA